MENININQIREEIRNVEQNRAKSTWFNPAKDYQRGDNGVVVLPETSYIGEAGGEPTWRDPVLNQALLQNNLSQLKSGKTDDIYKVTSDPFIGRWQEVAKQYADEIHTALKSGSTANLKSAGIGLSSDFAAIDIVNVQSQLLGTEIRTFSLEQAVTTVSTPSLNLKVDAFTGFQAQKNIGEATEPVTKLGSVARTSFDLPKDGTAIALSFEAQTRAVQDIYRIHVDYAIKDLKRIKASKIATELETATDVSGADWAGYTTDHSTVVPYDNIGAVTDIIVANNGNPDTIVSADRPWRDFIANTHFKGLGDNKSHTGPFSVARQAVGLEGFNWYIDNELTNTMITIFEKDAVYKMQGPIRTAVFRDEMKDVDMFRIFDFNLPKIVQSSKVRNLITVSA